MIARSYAGMNALGTVVSLPRKRGGSGRKDKAREGYEVDAFGRWRGYSVGSTLGFGVPGGGQAPREDPRHGCRNADASTRKATGLSRSSDSGSRIRQQHAATVVEGSRHRADHPGTTHQHPGDASGWPQTAPV